MDKNKLHGKHCELSKIQLWCLHGFLTNIYIYISLMYTPDYIFRVLPIKHMLNQDGEPTMSHKLSTVTKPVSKLSVLFCPCVVQKATKHVDTKALNMHHQLQNKIVAS